MASAPDTAFSGCGVKDLHPEKQHSIAKAYKFKCL